MAGDRTFQYWRFGDDAVIVAADPGICAEAYRTYIQVLDRLKLPYHHPVTVERYSREFWDGKSKAPFVWGSQVDAGQIPWCAFAGYQIRYDGAIRIRPSSVKRHLQKLTREGSRLRAVLREDWVSEIRIHPVRILERFRRRLKAMCCGRGRAKAAGLGIPECWTAGFVALRNKPIVGPMLKVLDRHRERQIGRVKRRLVLLFGRALVNVDAGQHSASREYRSSYAGQFPAPQQKKHPRQPR